ncbi:MAG: hypothetical protein JEZ14_08515 [Marinilabiliaceae bacterium]|nr:hypothetical protein [Marinilabiliaceae bacterium]
MKKFNVFFALLLGAMVSFTACSKDDELTAEELEAKQTKELVETITANFETITSKEWAYKEFQPSAEMLAASNTEDEALQRINLGNSAKKFNMVISFSPEGDLLKPSVAMGLPDDKLEQTVLDCLNAPYIEMGFVLYTELTESQLKSYLADYRRVVAAPFSADKLTTNQITSEETGRCIFTIGLRDYSEMGYEDVMLNQKKPIEGNSDKIYTNEDGTLTVETTSEKYGVSKVVLEVVE